MKIIKAVGW